MKVALYVRVSTHDQNCELQLRELEAHADREQWEITEIYQDILSGAKARRPGLPSGRHVRQEIRLHALLEARPIWTLSCGLLEQHSADTQAVALREYAERRGFDVIEYRDEGISGSKDSRPALDRLMKDVRARKFDV